MQAFRRAHLAAALVALLWAVPLLVTARCGRVLLKQDFNKYRGKRYAVWTQAQARSDFAVSGGSRPSADGVSRKPGPYNLALVRNAKVGYGHLKVYFRKGTPQPHEPALPVQRERAAPQARYIACGSWCRSAAGVHPGRCRDHDRRACVRAA